MCRTFLLSALACLATASSLVAQTLPPQYLSAMPKQYQELMTAMAAAQAKAVRPGDEGLGCPALENELMAAVNDPAIQAYAAKAGALVQKQTADAAKAPGAQTPQAAAALAAALGAGLPGAGSMPGMPGLAAQQALAAQAMQDQLAHMKVLLPILPQLMRSQHLMALASVKPCTWMTGATPFGPFAPPAR